MLSNTNSSEAKLTWLKKVAIFQILVCFSAAFEILCENLNSPSFENAVGANGDDVTFLSDLMNSLIVHGLVQVIFNLH